MLGKVAGVALILLPEFLGLHRVWGMSPVLVPGLPVGVLGDGCGGGGGGFGCGSVINSLENVKEHATLSAGASVDHGVEVEG